MINKIAAAVCTLFVFLCGWSGIWLANRYFHDSAPVEISHVALFVALFTVYYQAKFVMDNAKEKRDD